MHVARQILVAAALGVTAFTAPTSARGEPAPADFSAFTAYFRKEFDSDKPDARSKAVRRASQTVDARTVELLFEAEAKETARRAATEKQRTEAEASLETTLDEITKLQARSPTGQKAMDAYNKSAKRLQAKRDDAMSKLAEFAIDAVQSDAIISDIVGSMATVLNGLAPAVTDATLASALVLWGSPKLPVERRVHYVDLLAAITACPTGEPLRAIVNDPAEDQRLRTVALTARVARGDAGILEDAVALLREAPGPLLAAAIDGLRRIHRAECVEPLIACLARQDLGRQRTDAQRALSSLTGQKHGPYQQPWADWWKDAREKFTMPAHPASLTDDVVPDKGVTFYGITTFSDKILFVLDVSGSMLDKAHADAYGVKGEERKIDIARREIVAALAMLDEKKTFNAIFFGNRVVRLNAGMVPAERATLDRTKRLVNELEPSGGTNIHDALEAAFQMSGSNVDGKNYLSAIDTIYFMTDGTPTAGKLVKPDDILAAVRGWNRLAKITIHCVAVGDACDEAFLKTLASESAGIFVHR